MPITMGGDPPGTRVLTRRLGQDGVDEEKVVEWSPNGRFVKMRQRSGGEAWEDKNLVDVRMVILLDPNPVIVP